MTLRNTPVITGVSVDKDNEKKQGCGQGSKRRCQSLLWHVLQVYIEFDVGKILQFVGPLPFRSDDTRIDESNVEIKHANDYYESSYQ